MNPKNCVVDEDAQPKDLRDEVLPADDLARAVSQNDQNIQGAATQFNRGAGFLQKPFRRGQPERAE